MTERTSPPGQDLALALISVVLPAHNEEAGISRAFDVIGRTLDDCGVRWEIIAVDDGSQDKTFAVVSQRALDDNRIHGIHFSRNFGKEVAMTPANYCITRELLEKKAKPDAILLHSLPRMDEIPPDVDITRWSRYWQEAFNGVVMRMTLLALVLGAME